MNLKDRQDGLATIMALSVRNQNIFVRFAARVLR